MASEVSGPVAEDDLGIFPGWDLRHLPAPQLDARMRGDGRRHQGREAVAVEGESGARRHARLARPCR